MELNLKKIVIGFVLVCAVGISGFSYKVYDNYQTREDKINHVLKFQKVAFEAYTMLVSGNNKKAVNLYAQAIALHDEDTKTLLDYSNALAHIGENKKAVEMFERAYQNANYKNEDVLIQLANMNYKINNYEKSLYYYKEAVERFRPKYRYIQKIILSLDKLDNSYEAMKYFAYIQEKSPDYFSDKREFDKFALLYTKNTKAKDLLPKYDTTDDIDKLLALGQKYEKDGLDDKALKAYDKVLYQRPSHQKANLYVADLLLGYGDYDFALIHLKQLNSKDFETFFKLGGAYHQSKNYIKAIEAYEEALKYNENALLYKNLASCAFRNGDTKKVIKYLKQLEQKDPRMAYNLEYATLLSTGKEMSKKDKLIYQSVNTWYDLKDFFLKSTNET